IIKDGFKVALIGAPNVGKSTLLNALTDSDRAIVTPIAGTTRDTVDGEYVYRGKKFCVTDTAGLTETDDVVEKIGVERAKKAAEDADAVVFVTVDGGKTPDGAKTAAVTVVNKNDGIADVGDNFKAAEKKGGLYISAKCGKNITALKAKLYELCPKTAGGICNHRQYDCVTRALAACEAAREESKKAQGLEIVAAALFDAYSAIQELYGEGDRADEKVIETVFERFCVGK
ncbi:MAG: 50S ribosome-binding GTPase, partial [Clostridiales bacterium]|nr:50S ribosome-binding GTPase [Clostridiales bacterium]